MLAEHNAEITTCATPSPQDVRVFFGGDFHGAWSSRTLTREARVRMMVSMIRTLSSPPAPRPSLLPTPPRSLQHTYLPVQPRPPRPRGRARGRAHPQSQPPPRHTSRHCPVDTRDTSGAATVAASHSSADILDLFDDLAPWADSGGVGSLARQPACTRRRAQALSELLGVEVDHAVGQEKTVSLTPERM